MTLDNVRRLLSRIGKDPALRDRLNGAKDQAEREAVLADEDLSFTQAEFEQMIDLLHAQCQTEVQAEYLFEFRNWWEFLSRS